jgi:N utilization substance protein A
MVTEVELDDENKRAIVSVPEDQQSLAIGKEGQNARLANKLTKWKIDIKGAAGIFGAVAEGEAEEGKDKTVKGVWDEAIKEKKSTKEEEKEAEEEVKEEKKEEPEEEESKDEPKEDAKDEPKEDAKDELEEKPEDDNDGNSEEEAPAVEEDK